MANPSRRPRGLLHAAARGGAFTYAVELARALAARRVEVVLATDGAPLDGARRAALEAVPLAGRHEAAFRLEGMDDPVAADARRFRPLGLAKEGELVFVGNWGDGDRSAEQRTFLLDPVEDASTRSAQVCARRIVASPSRASEPASAGSASTSLSIRRISAPSRATR